MATFTGGLSCANPTARQAIVSGSSEPLLTSNDVQIETASFVFGEVDTVYYFAVALETLPATMVGVVPSDSMTFTGALTTAQATMNGRRSGRQFREVIFMNEVDLAFDDTNLNSFIDQYYPQPVSGAISGSGSFTSQNQLTGGDLLTAGTPHKRTVRVRRYELGNKRALEINPLVQRAMSKKVRTYIQTPANYQLSMTWKIPKCFDDFASTLIGLLYFKQFRMVLGDEEFICVLLDDIVKTIKESRTKKSITLNFQGKRIP